MRSSVERLAIWGGLSLALIAPLLMAVQKPSSVVAAEFRHGPASPEFGSQQSARLAAIAAEAEGERWYLFESANFKVFTCCPHAERRKLLGEELERSREALRKFCALRGEGEAWQAKCVVVFHPTPESYTQHAGDKAAGAWGRAVILRERGEISSRRIDLCATSWRRVAETLTHELTHIVLADFFAERNVPRWLDEGLAVHVEPLEKFERRAAASRGQNLLPQFSTAKLLAISEYPAGVQRQTFYAESGQLVRLLLELNDANSLLKFAKLGDERGYRRALQEVYGLENLDELDELRSKRATGPQLLQASYTESK